MPNRTNDRINFSKTKIKLDYPDLLGIQLQSFQDFFQLETTPDKRVAEGLFSGSRKFSDQ
jgi:DNA-directed RNA polymerase subunit beta